MIIYRKLFSLENNDEIKSGLLGISGISTIIGGNKISKGLRKYFHKNLVSNNNLNQEEVDRLNKILEKEAKKQGTRIIKSDRHKTSYYTKLSPKKLFFKKSKKVRERGIKK